MSGRSFRRTPEEPGPPRNRNNRNNRRGRGGGASVNNHTEEDHRPFTAPNDTRHQPHIPSLLDYRAAPPVPQWTANDPVWGTNTEEPAQARPNRTWRGRGGGPRRQTNRTADPIVIDSFGNVYTPTPSMLDEWPNHRHVPPSIYQLDEPTSFRGGRNRRGRGSHQPISHAVPPHLLIADASDGDSDNTSIFSLMFAPEPTPARRNNRNRGGRGRGRQQGDNRAPAPSRNNRAVQDSGSNRETVAGAPFQRPEMVFPNADDEWGTDGGWGGRRREEPAVAEPTSARRNRNRSGRGGARQQGSRTAPSRNAQLAERPQAQSARDDGGVMTWDFERGGFDDPEPFDPDAFTEFAPAPRDRNRRGRRGGNRQRPTADSSQDAIGNWEISRNDNEWGSDWGGGFGSTQDASVTAESASTRRSRNRRRNRNRRQQQAAPAAASGTNPLPGFDPSNAEITSNEWAQIVNPRARNNNNEWPPGFVPSLPPGLAVPPGLGLDGFEIGPPPGFGRARGNRMRDRLRREEELRAADPYSYLDELGHRRSQFDFVFDYVGEYLGDVDNFSDDLTVSSTPEPDEDPEQKERLKHARDVDLQDDTLAMRYSRACGVCQISPNPRVRVVLTGCGHIVCAPCSEQLDKVGRKVRCPFCRVTGGLLRLFEELEEEDTSCQISA